MEGRDDQNRYTHSFILPTKSSSKLRSSLLQSHRISTFSLDDSSREFWTLLIPPAKAFITKTQNLGCLQMKYWLRTCKALVILKLRPSCLSPKFNKTLETLQCHSTLATPSLSLARWKWTHSPTKCIRRSFFGGQKGAAGKRQKTEKRDKERKETWIKQVVDYAKYAEWPSNLAEKPTRRGFLCGSKETAGKYHKTKKNTRERVEKHGLSKWSKFTICEGTLSPIHQ